MWSDSYPSVQACAGFASSQLSAGLLVGDAFSMHDHDRPEHWWCDSFVESLEHAADRIAILLL